MSNQDDFTNRICGHCSKGFVLEDPHYYDEEQGECYCDEECYKKENEEVLQQEQQGKSNNSN